MEKRFFSVSKLRSSWIQKCTDAKNDPTLLTTSVQNVIFPVKYVIVATSELTQRIREITGVTDAKVSNEDFWFAVAAIQNESLNLLYNGWTSDATVEGLVADPNFNNPKTHISSGILFRMSEFSYTETTKKPVKPAANPSAASNRNIEINGIKYDAAGGDAVSYPVYYGVSDKIDLNKITVVVTPQIVDNNFFRSGLGPLHVAFPDSNNVLGGNSDGGVKTNGGVEGKKFFPFVWIALNSFGNFEHTAIGVSIEKYLSSQDYFRSGNFDGSSVPHELAHLLGLEHSFVDKSCTPEGAKYDKLARQLSGDLPVTQLSFQTVQNTPLVKQPTIECSEKVTLGAEGGSRLTVCGKADVVGACSTYNKSGSTSVVGEDIMNYSAYNIRNILTRGQTMCLLHYIENAPLLRETLLEGQYFVNVSPEPKRSIKGAITDPSGIPASFFITSQRWPVLSAASIQRIKKSFPRYVPFSYIDNLIALKKRNASLQKSIIINKQPISLLKKDVVPAELEYEGVSVQEVLKEISASIVKYYLLIPKDTISTLQQELLDLDVFEYVIRLKQFLFDQIIEKIFDEVIFSGNWQQTQIEILKVCVTDALIANIDDLFAASESSLTASTTLRPQIIKKIENLIVFCFTDRGTLFATPPTASDSVKIFETALKDYLKLDQQTVKAFTNIFEDQLKKFRGDVYTAVDATEVEFEDVDPDIPENATSRTFFEAMTRAGLVKKYLKDLSCIDEVYDSVKEILKDLEADVVELLSQEGFDAWVKEYVEPLVKDDPKTKPSDVVKSLLRVTSYADFDDIAKSLLSECVTEDVVSKHVPVSTSTIMSTSVETQRKKEWSLIFDCGSQLENSLIIKTKIISDTHPQSANITFFIMKK